MTTHYSSGSAGTPADSYRATPPSRPSQFWNDHTAAIHAHADTGAAVTEAFVDRSDAPDDQFAPLLARLEAAEAVDIGEDARVERLTIHLADALLDDLGGRGLNFEPSIDVARRLLAQPRVSAALAAMHPAHEVERIADERAAEALEQAAGGISFRAAEEESEGRDVASAVLDEESARLYARAASLRAASRGDQT